MAFVWLLIEMTSWLSSELAITTKVPFFIALFFLSLLPAICLLSYNHGAKGRDNWKKTEIATLIINLIISTLIVYLAANKNNATTNTKTAALALEKEVKQKRISIALIPPKNSIEKNNSWLPSAFNLLLHMDLEQNKSIRVAAATSSSYLAYSSSGSRLPLKHTDLKSASYAAKSIGVDYFITGEIKSNKKNFIVDISLYSSSPTKKHGTKTCHNELYMCIDELSVWVKNTLNIKAESDDLPAKKLINIDEHSLKKYVEAINYIRTQQLVSAHESLKDIIAKHPDFGLAYVELAIETLQRQGDTEKSLALINKALMFEKSLPRDLVYLLKQSKFSYEKSILKEQKLVELWHQREPNNYYAETSLIKFYLKWQKMNLAINLLKEKIQRYPQYKYQLSRLYYSMGLIEKAISLAEEIYKKNPDAHELGAYIGELHFYKGDYERAFDLIDNASIMDSNNVYTKLLRIELLVLQGKFQKALDLLSKLADNSLTQPQQLKVASIYNLMNMYDKSIKILTKNNSKPSEMMVKNLSHQMILAETYALTGEYKEAKKIIYRLSKSYGEAIKPNLDIIALKTSFFASDYSTVQKKLEHIKKEYLNYPAFTVEAEIINCIISVKSSLKNLKQLHMRRCDKALEVINNTGRMLRTSPLFKLFNIYYSKHLILNYSDQVAEKHIKKSLSYWPAQPELWLQLSNIEKSKGNLKQSQYYLDKSRSMTLPKNKIPDN